MKQVSARILESGVGLEKISTSSGLSIERLQAILNGSEPTLSELRQLAAALKIRISDFVGENGARHRAQLLFRETLTTRNRSEPGLIDGLSRQIGHSLELLPDNCIQNSKLAEFRIKEESFVEAASSAERFREIFLHGDMVSPLLQLPQLAIEEIHILLFIVPQQRVDGASAIVNGYPFVFVAPRFPPRMLFTLAHEIGHLIAHHEKDQEFASLDFRDETGRIKRDRKKNESFADVFASCLLLPAAGVGIALKKIRQMSHAKSDEIGDIEILYLSRIFGVSFQAAAVRCEDLDLLPRGGAISIYEKLCKEHKSPEKRAEQIKLPPRPKIEFPSVPRNLLFAAIKKIQNGEMSIGRASVALNLSISDIMSQHSVAH